MDRPKLKIHLDDAKTRAIWEAIQRARADVERWPPSKRGEDGPYALSSGRTLRFAIDALTEDTAAALRHVLRPRTPEELAQDHLRELAPEDEREGL